MSLTDQLLNLAISLLKQILTRLGLFSQFQTDALAELGLIESQTALIGSGQTPADLAVPTILARLDNLSAGIGATQSLIAFGFNRLGTPPFTVTLPPTPPPGYGGASAAAVWDYQFPPGSGNIMGDQMNDAAYGAQNLGTLSRMDYPYNANVQRHFDYSREDSVPTTPIDLVIDPTTILQTDADVVSWLNRTLPAYAWTYLGDMPISYHNTTGGDDWWISKVGPAEFAFWKRFLASPAGSATAPVWPGIANVTLGASLALADGLSVPGPLHGVIVHIASVAPPISFYPFGAVKSFVRAGALVFVDDNGDAEFPAPFGPDHEIICPRQMERAAHVVVRLTSGVVGTITPWLHV